MAVAAGIAESFLVGCSGLMGLFVCLKGLGRKKNAVLSLDQNVAVICRRAGEYEAVCLTVFPFSPSIAIRAVGLP